METNEAFEIIGKFRLMADVLLPTLTPGEQAVVIQIFARSIETGSCRDPYRQLAKHACLAESGTSKILKGLIAHGTITAVKGQSRKQPNQYNVTYPFVPGPTENGKEKVPKHGIVLSAALPQHQPPVPPSILDSLTGEGIAEVDRMFASLSEEELRRYRLRASIVTTAAGDLTRRIKELIVEDSFGPATMERYRRADVR